MGSPVPHHRAAPKARAALIAGLLLAIGGGTYVQVSAIVGDLSTQRDLHGAEHAQSAACQRCHPDHHESWAETFHSTMTQEATDETVLGPFEGERFTYGGITTVFSRTPGGAYRMRFEGSDGAFGQAEVVQTVGSHRYQQYLARRDDVLFRLPLAWHIQEQRWFHMNGAFLTPDPPEPEEGQSIERADFMRHVTRWNDNCIFCHVVAGNPNQNARTGRFRSESEEFGIACESCHGPGEEHARLNTNPLRRYALHLSSHPDPSIVNPDRLTPSRSADVCGRCHGQRITSNLSHFMTEGDPFVPGDDLDDYSRPLTRTTPLEGRANAFENRFWQDGTPRLTAYEYQGLRQSRCAEAGLTCTDCHGMHDSPPAGQLRPEAATDAVCVTCHETYESRSSADDHSHHRAIACVSCHMPRVVYGVLDIHRSHRIGVPAPQGARPDACTLCHAERGQGWARAEMARLWPHEDSVLGGALETSPRVSRQLLGGDPIERAVAAAALGRVGAPLRANDTARRRGLLLDTMARDPYPAVRAIAWRSLRALSEDRVLHWQRYVPTGSGAERRAWVERAAAQLGSRVAAPDALETERLRQRAERHQIEIGE